MNSITAQQVALDNALAAPENRVKIGICNMRINPRKNPKEPTYQVVLDALTLSPFYPAFLITAEFKLDKKKCRVDVEVFRTILQICLRLSNQEFVIPPSSDPKIVSFIKELGYTGDIDFVTKVYTDHMHQPWRTFAAVINDDSILGSLRFVSKTEEYQVYGALIPAWMTNRKMLNSTAYKTYLAFATGAATPKKAREFKKPTSPSKKKTPVVVEEPAEKPAKKFAAKDSLLVFKSKILLLKKAIKQSKRETNIHQASGSSEGAGIEPKIFSKSEYESWGDSDDDNDDDDQQSNDEQNVFDNPRISDGEEETQEDEFVRTPENYVPSDDENIDDEEYERINKEMYHDVNVELKDAEPADKGKGDEEMTDAEQVDDENEKVNQEVVGDQVNDDAQATVTAALATQKTEVPLQSSSISSDYATKFLNFDNIPSADTEIISMMNIKVQHEDPSSQTSPLLIVHVLVIPESSTAPATTIPPPIPSFIPLP
ncbi:hypothetical protein Tco_0506375 [Tanacetum coccineum]